MALARCAALVPAVSVRNDSLSWTCSPADPQPAGCIVNGLSLNASAAGHVLPGVRCCVVSCRKRFPVLYSLPTRIAAARREGEREREMKKREKREEERRHKASQC